METGVDATLFNAAALVLVTAGAVILMNLLWPSSHPHEMQKPKVVNLSKINKIGHIIDKPNYLPPLLISVTAYQIKKIGGTFRI